MSFVTLPANLNFVTLPWIIIKKLPASDLFFRDFILSYRVFYWLVRWFRMRPSTFTACISDFFTIYCIFFISTCSWWKYICIWCDSFLPYISALLTSSSVFLSIATPRAVFNCSTMALFFIRWWIFCPKYLNLLSDDDSSN